MIFGLFNKKRAKRPARIVNMGQTQAKSTRPTFALTRPRIPALILTSPETNDKSNNYFKYNPSIAVSKYGPNNMYNPYDKNYSKDNYNQNSRSNNYNQNSRGNFANQKNNNKTKADAPNKRPHNDYYKKRYYRLKRDKLIYNFNINEKLSKKITWVRRYENKKRLLKAELSLYKKLKIANAINKKLNSKKNIRRKLFRIKRHYEFKVKNIRRIFLRYKQKQSFDRFTKIDRAAIASGMLMLLKKRAKRKEKLSKEGKNVTKEVNKFGRKLKRLKKFLDKVASGIKAKAKARKPLVSSKHKNFRVKKSKNSRFKKRKTYAFNIFKEKLKIFLRDRFNGNPEAVGSRLMLLLQNFDLIKYWQSSFYLKLENNKIDRLRRLKIERILNRTRRQLQRKRFSKWGQKVNFKHYLRSEKPNHGVQELFFVLKRKKHKKRRFFTQKGKAQKYNISESKSVISFFPFWFQNFSFSRIKNTK